MLGRIRKGVGVLAVSSLAVCAMGGARDAVAA
ncbi:MAG: hypothetical protein H6Q85_1627, partial [candidate division NC10 bacterium]|nr:hypothetical protein [candidate division NC10 bacterium]